ncbi:MAG: LssY C-terminal domain-containing protein [Propionibacteriales bacterium]|nr:LssY C-terminal domain-containing protein [Propionibacteriales bacterium]
MANPTPTPGVMRRWSMTIDHAFFVLAGVFAVWLAALVLVEGVAPGWPMVLLIVFWVLVAYLVLPRLHRILTRIYLPDYFIGRTRTADGLLGDPVNLALNGSAEQLHRAMADAGWTRADELSVATGWRIVAGTVTGRSYPQAPVSPLFLFSRRQDFAYQQEVANSPSKRHHVRFWRCPDGWLLPGGFAVDWLGAATYDRSVGLSLFTLQVTHKIEAEVDIERDYLIDTITAAHPEASLRVLADFSTGYHSRNGGGDVIRTDGDLPIVQLDAVAAEAAADPVAAEASGRPPQTVFGVVVTLLRGLTMLWLAALVNAGAGEFEAVTPEAMVVLAVFLLIAGMVDLVLAVAVWFGFNWARLALLTLSLWSVAVVLIGRVLAGDNGPLHADLLPLAISVLLLLALSSAPARQFATRPQASPGAIEAGE